MKWEQKKLGNVLMQTNRFEERKPLESYTFSGTYSFARGIFKSSTKQGTEFNLNKVQRIRANDFVYCKIMAWEGAFGLVPEECDNTVMSGAFVAYEIDNKKLEPKFLDYYFKVERFWREAGNQSTGTNVRRKTLFPKDFENYEIPLPPLPEQKRIVAKLDAIKSKIEEIKQLRAEQEREIRNFQSSYFEDLLNNEDCVPIGDV